MLILPVVLLGAVLTISVFGAYFGIPLLLLAWWPFRVGRRAVRQPENPSTERRLAMAAGFAGAILSVVVATTIVAGWDDLDSPDAFVGLIVGVAWTAGFWWVALAARQLTASQDR